MELFSPDVFSQSIPVYSSVSEVTRQRIESVFKTAFAHMGTPIEVSQCGGNEINSNNFKVVLNKENEVGEKFLLKRILLSPGKLTELKQQAGLSEGFRLSGLPMPTFVGTAESGLFYADSDYAWCLQRFIPGHYFRGNIEELQSTSQVFLKLNELCSIAPNGKPTESVPFVNLNSDNPAWKVVERPRDYVGTLGVENVELLEMQGDFIFQVRELLDKSRDVLVHEPELCYIDWHPHNLITHNGELVGVLDFESLRPAQSRIMRAYGCYKLIRQAGVFHYDQREEVMAHFRSTLQLDRLLKTSLLNVQSDFASAEILRRLCSILSLNATQGNTAWNPMLKVMIRSFHELPKVFGLEQ